jgi:hypothetical protein
MKYATGFRPKTEDGFQQPRGKLTDDAIAHGKGDGVLAVYADPDRRDNPSDLSKSGI